MYLIEGVPNPRPPSRSFVTGQYRNNKNFLKLLQVFFFFVKDYHLRMILFPALVSGTVFHALINKACKLTLAMSDINGFIERGDSHAHFV